MIEQKIINLINHFGAIVSTEGIHEDIKKHCNVQLSRLVHALDKLVDETLAISLGIIT